MDSTDTEEGPRRYTELVRPRLPRVRIVGGILAAVVSFASYRPHPGADLELEEGMLLRATRRIRGRSSRGSTGKSSLRRPKIRT